jgi:hypothetical protein
VSGFDRRRVTAANRRSHRIWLVTAVAACALLASGCGGTGSGKSAATKDRPADTIAEVSGGFVTKHELEHWLPVEAVLASTDPVPTKAVPAGLIPDPPAFEACARYEGTYNLKASGETTPALKRRCAARYESIRRHMLTILVTFQWLSREAAHQGIRLTNAEVEREVARYEGEQFHSDAAFKAFLRYSGETLADELLVSRMDELGTRLQQKVVAERGVAGARKFFTEFPRRWKRVTSCRSGYVIPNCREYKGPAPPEPSV